MSRLKLPEIIQITRDASSLRSAHRDINRQLRAKPPERVWREFFDWQKDRIDQVAREVKKRDLAIIYGAGNCQGFNLPFLADYFKRVVLVDIEEEAVSIAREKLPSESRKKVDIELRDVSNCLDSLIVPAGHFISREYGPQKSFENMVAAVNDSADVLIANEGEKADFVLSSDLASTISLVPIAWLYAKFCDTFRELNVDFTRFELSFLPYMTASFLFHLINLSNHFDADTIGVITSSSVESPLIFKDDEIMPAYFIVNPQSGERQICFRAALGEDLRYQGQPLTQENAILLSFEHTEFGVTSQKDVFVLENLLSEAGEQKVYSGMMNEFSVVRKFEHGALVNCDKQRIIVM